MKLLDKLCRMGVCDLLMTFFENYLAPRRARVAVNGADSFKFILQNIMFQGTILGPSLWNIFFADVHEPADKNCAKEKRFSDVLSISKHYNSTTANGDVLTDLAIHNMIFTRGAEIT